MEVAVTLVSCELVRVCVRTCEVTQCSSVRRETITGRMSVGMPEV